MAASGLAILDLTKLSLKASPAAAVIA